MTFELDAVLRWLRPGKRHRGLARRSDAELPWVVDARLIGPPVLVDTTVYIDVLQGRSPAALDELISMRTCYHSSVCLSELTNAFGRLDPADSRTASALEPIARTIREIPQHRLVAPDSTLWGSAGILAGLLFRLGSHSVGAEQRCLNDALIYLQARKHGWPVLSGNIADFDFLNQLVPDGGLLVYRKERN